LTPPPHRLPCGQRPQEEVVGRVLLELSVVEQRYDAVMEVLRDGLGVSEVARRYGVSRQSLHAWLRRYEEGGLSGLADRSHRPKTCPHQIAAEVEARICEMRRKNSEWGPRRIHYELGKEGWEPCPSRASIYRALLRNRLIEADRRRRRKRVFQRFERARPMELWQLDVTGGVKLDDGRELKVVTGVDDHSRFCVLALVVERATARVVCRTFSEAVRRYGIPDEVLTDNGKVFTGRFGRVNGEVLFERILRENGITHRLTGVRSPTTTGKVERFHQTLKRELLRKHRFASLEEAQAAVDRWVSQYNQDRPHQSIGMQRPVDRFHSGTATTVSVVNQSAEGPGSMEIQRRVWSNGVVRVAYQAVSVGRPYAGELVTIRVQGGILHVLHDGRLVRSVPRNNRREVRYIRGRRSPKDGKKVV
jgi:transposase InsO family protein